MSVVSPEATSHALHQIGVLIWLGSLFFMRLVLLPATRSESDPMIRMRVRIDAYKRMFRWGAVGLLLVWGSGLWQLDVAAWPKLPLHVQLMAGAATIMVALHLFGYLSLYLNMEVAVAEERLLQSAKNNFWIRKLIWINLVLGLTAAFFGAAGSYLFR